jgi:hypothetical protein
MDPGPHRGFVEAVQGCYAQVPEFQPFQDIPATNFEYAYCLHEEGLPVIVDPYYGDIVYWRCEGTAEGMISGGGDNSPQTDEEIAAAAVCETRVPAYGGNTATER